MLAAHLPRQPLRRVALAVVLRRTIALHDGLRRQKEDLALRRVHHHRARHWMTGRDPPVAVMRPAAVLAMHARRGEAPHLIDREQRVTVQPNQSLQSLDALLRPNHPREGRAQRRIARRTLNPVQAPGFALIVSSVLASRSNRSSDGDISPNTTSPDSTYSLRLNPRPDTGSSTSSQHVRTTRSSPGASPRPLLGHDCSHVTGEIMTMILNFRSIYLCKHFLLIPPTL